MKPDQIPFDDFGGAGAVIHFAHANGYPPTAYQPLLERLTQRYRVFALHARPLWPDTPAQPNVADNWDWLVDDLLAGVVQHCAAPLVGVGHSMGAVATLLAAHRRPELFRGVILIDPTILTGWLSLMYRALRLTGQMHRFSLVRGTLKRRRVYENLQAMYARYRQKPLYAGIDDQDLQALVRAQARPRDDGRVELRYPPEWEAHVYAATPIGLWPCVQNLAVPVLIIAGAESFVFNRAARRQARRRLPASAFRLILDAGHLAPLERPCEAAQAIWDFTAGLSSPQVRGRDRPGPLDLP